MIFCSQYDTHERYHRIDCERGTNEDSAVAEAILDRIIHNKYSIFVDGKVSMRKRHASMHSTREVSLEVPTMNEEYSSLFHECVDADDCEIILEFSKLVDQLVKD